MHKNCIIILLFGLVTFSLSAQNGVGIGTNSPAAKLDVQALGDGAEVLRLTTDRPWVFKQGGSGSTTRLVLESTVDLKGFEISSLGGINRAAQFLTSTVGSTVRLVPDGGGVGLGFDGAIGGQLHIQENSHPGHPQLRLTEEDYDYARIKMENLVEPGTYWDIAGRADSTLANARLNFYFYSPNGWGDRMTIRGTGDVGIGTTSPEAKLDVAGGEWNLEAGNPGDLRIGNPASNLRIGVATGGGGAGISRIFSTNTMWLGTANQRRVTIASDGKVGIGLDNPSELLHVNGTFRVNDLAGTGDRNVIVDGNGKFKIGTVGVGDTDWNETATQVISVKEVYVDEPDAPTSTVTIDGRTTNGNNFAALAIYNNTFFPSGTYDRLLLDADDIDAFRGSGATPISETLHLQRLSAGDLHLVHGGGNIGINMAATGSKLTLEGPDNNGTVAGLEIHSAGSSQVMLIDGNEIDAASNLHLNANTGFPVSIGTLQIASGYALSVKGKIIAEEVRVQLQSSWPDYVFRDDYRLMPLEELQSHIRSRGHLPGIPAAADIENAGLDVGEMQRSMMEKIEELTLYIIDLNERLETLETENRALRAISKSH